MVEIFVVQSIKVLQYEEIWDMIIKLSKMIMINNYTPDVLIGISRGGLVITRILSDIFGINEVSTIGVGFYQGINQTNKEPVLKQDLCYDVANKKVLLIDDVADTGKSIEFVLKYLEKSKIKEIKTATLHYKPHSTFKPDFFISETSDWIVYPWEYLEFTRLYYKKELEKGKKKADIIRGLSKISLPKKVIKEVIK
ncbi:MAG: phosphoribosyltransferase [Asgard group archaeon]|nr:phosphoribosyltransferase [Asgard group archaeon]